MAKVPLKFGLVVFPGFEALDAFGPLEVLNSLDRNPNFRYKGQTSLSILAYRQNPQDQDSQVFPYPVSTGLKPLTGGIEQSIVPTHAFDEEPDVDVLIVPGGLGTRPKLADGTSNPNVQPVLDYLQRTFPKLQYLFSSGLAAQAGLLDNVSATTNKAAWASITALGPKTRWVGRARWVVSGENRKIWTTSGVSAGIDGFLALLEEIYGEGVADEACRQMEYTRARNPGDDPWAKVYELDGVGRA